ncbi:MAG: alpha/beta hydrolase [Chloroflexaceae bacterium]|nr:alpha/beta hydrolase [Chloroflexaceae bacterium]
MPFITTRHGDMHYLTVGSGHPLVLIHGNTYTAATQERLAQRFADVHTVYSVDLLAHGKSARPAGLFTTRYFAMQGEALADLLSGLFPGRAVPVFGMSAGGITALNAVCHVPERIAALVLDGIFMEISPETVAAHHHSTASMSATWHRYMRSQHGEEWWALLNAGVQSAVEQLEEAGTIVTPCLETIAVPTLIFQGGNDPFVPNEQAYAVAEAIPHARVVYDPAAGHLLAWKDPAAFREKVRIFLNEVL